VTSITITNLLGEKVYQQAISDKGIANSIAVDLSSQPKGIYFVEAIIGNKRKTEKIIIE
jgi:hypothetical protein